MLLTPLNVVHCGGIVAVAVVVIVVHCPVQPDGLQFSALAEDQLAQPSEFHVLGHETEYGVKLGGKGDQSVENGKPVGHDDGLPVNVPHGPVQVELPEQLLYTLQSDADSEVADAMSLLGQDERQEVALGVAQYDDAADCQLPSVLDQADE